jgi:glycyl-tRNA synthetase
MTQQGNNLMDKITSLCKRRGFVFPCSEIYGGLANSWDFGPLGVEMKNNIKKEWWKTFVYQKSDIVGLDSSIIINPKVWQASGHSDGFNDPLIECRKCHSRFRADVLLGDQYHLLSESEINKKSECPQCKEKGSFTLPRNFNLMLKTFLGPVEDQAGQAFLRPETAQGIFVNFKNVLNVSRKTIPFGIAQIGKAFRNEITPGNYIFRTREFEQMEIEYFINPSSDWQKVFESWRKEMQEWIKRLGIPLNKINELDVPQEELAHYSLKTIDFEYKFPFGTKELYGLAYRTDFDLRNHQEKSGENMKYRDPETNKEYWPHVIEPTFGVERTFLACLIESYREEKVKDEIRVFLELPFWLAPIKVAFLPLVKNNQEIVSLTKEIRDSLSGEMNCDYDETGAIGRRYRRQDEIGTPFCVTVDFDSLEKKDVTVRNRDTMQQTRIPIKELKDHLKKSFE